MTGGGRAPHAALAAQTLLAAATYLAAKRTLAEVDPWTVAMLRFSIAAAAFVAILGVGRSGLPPRGARGRILFLGVLAVPVNQLCFLEGLARSSPSHAALAYALTPAGVRVLDRLLRGTRTSAREDVGLLLALGGVLVVLTRPGTALAPQPLLGDAFLLSGMVAWALYTVLSKPLVEVHGALPVSGWTLLAGTAVTLPFGVPALARAPYAAYSALAWFGIVYLALITSVVCYALWTFALRRLRSTQVAVWANLQPPVAALLSYLVLGERIGGALALGGSLVIAGVALTQFDRRRERGDEAKGPGATDPAPADPIA